VIEKKNKGLLYFGMTGWNLSIHRRDN